MPRRFGKSYAANMLAAYYSKGADSKEMFSGLEISKCSDFEEHLNKYDVIHIDVQWAISVYCNGKAGEFVSRMTKEILQELRNQYPGILPEGDMPLSKALLAVTENVGSKFVIIIDEWDVLIRVYTDDPEVQNAYFGFLRDLCEGPETGKYLQLAYLTGILPVGEKDTQYSINSFVSYSMLDAGPFAQYTGLTADEVAKLAKERHQNLEKLNQWYGGYVVGSYQVYYPQSVVTALNRNEYGAFWSGTGSWKVVVPLISRWDESLKGAIADMLSGQLVKVGTLQINNDVGNFQSRDDVLTYLVHLGYLAYDKAHGTVGIPNIDVLLSMAPAEEMAFGIPAEYR